MRKALLLPAVLLAGCSPFSWYGLALPQPHIMTNIPWNVTIVTVVNGTTDLTLDVIHDGQLVQENLAPGQYMSVAMRNFSGTYAQSSIVVLAKSKDKLVGSASRQFYVTGFYRQSESWRVTNSELVSGGY